MEKSSPPNGRACLSRASHQRCGPAASRDSPAAMRRGSSRRKPAGRYPEVLPRMGLPAPSPGSGATPTRVHLSSYPHESGTPRPQNFAPPRSWIRVGHGEPFRQRNTSALVAPGLSESGRRALPPTLGDLVASVPRRPAIRHYRPAGRAGMATARRSPASHALHCLRLPGRRNIRLIADSMQALRPGRSVRGPMGWLSRRIGGRPGLDVLLVATICRRGSREMPIRQGRRVRRQRLISCHRR